jgi:hypothetical protein
VSAFFELPPPPPEPQEHRQPEWIGPPGNVLPGTFPLSLVLARTPDVALAVGNGAAFPNGFTFTLAVRLRQVDERGHGPIHRWHMPGAIDDDVLRFGIRFPDGAKATIFDMRRNYGSEQEPSSPVLMQRGGGGGGHAWDMGFWVWPLPPAGRFAFVCEWPGYGIGLTEIEIDTAPIRDAAARAETLWPDDDGPSGAGGMVFSRQVG